MRPPLDLLDNRPPPSRGNSRGLLVFAVLFTGGLTLILGRPASSQKLASLPAIVVSSGEAEYRTETDTLRRGEVLAQVLARQSLSPNQTAEAVEALSAYANPRRLRAGVAVQVSRTAWDSLVDVTVHVDPDRLVRLVPNGTGWGAELSELTVTVDTMVVAGVIESSLYNSVMDLPLVGLSAQERIEQMMWGIYDPFQWSIDFGLDIRSGDRYRAVYERHVRPDGSVRYGKVLAAEFVNRGKIYRAYWYPEREEYFDEDGGSMRRVFLKAPVDFRRISSRFSKRRYHPKLGVYRAHLGTDYAADTGTQVFSTADGTVTRADWWGGYGRLVEIRHVNGYRTRYGHLSAITRGIKAGVKVRQGQVIGRVGSSGLATGPHLHYEMLHNGKQIDARAVNLPSGEPVASDHLAEFRRQRERLVSYLRRAEETGGRLVD
ncbi:MAG: M23 family metallopeptidase [Gemmatimonadota bacterium]|nr:MAG: M23 family metallopeptidase [Gemmatimonadota bacterium]